MKFFFSAKKNAGGKNHEQQQIRNESINKINNLEQIITFRVSLIEDYAIILQLHTDLNTSHGLKKRRIVWGDGG